MPTSSNISNDQSQVSGHCSLRSGSPRKVQAVEEAVVGQEGPQGAWALGSAPNHRALSASLPPPPGPERVCTWVLTSHLSISHTRLLLPLHASDTKQDKENSRSM